MNNLDTTFFTTVTLIIIVSVAIALLILIIDKFRRRWEQQYEEQHYDEMNTPNELTGLTATEENVLDIYEQSNIKIPLEILEELRYLQLDDEEEIFMYIENQRLHWKLENSKKPYRRK